MSVSLSGPVLGKGEDANLRNLFKDFPLSRDPDYVGFMYDFIEVDDDQTNLYTVVKDTGASVGIAADTVSGVLTLSSAGTTDDDGSSIQGNEIIALSSNRSIWFEARLSVSDADQMDVFCGLSLNFSTNPEAVLTATDRVGFQIDDGDASILCKAEKDGTETSKDSEEDASDDTYVKLGMRITGTAKVEYFIDRLKVAEASTNLPDDENLTWAVMELSGNATGTKSMALDYLMCYWTR